MDWLDSFWVQGTLTSLFQHHRSKLSIFQCSAFSIVQFSHPYVTTGKTIALTRQTFDSKVISLLFNKLSRLVVSFLPRSKSLLISRLQAQFAVILELEKITSVTVSIVSHLFDMKWWDWMSWSLFFECWVLSQHFHSSLSHSSRGTRVPLRFLFFFFFFFSFFFLVIYFLNFKIFNSYMHSQTWTPLPLPSP